MKNFIIKIIALGIILLLSAFVADFVVTSGLKKTGNRESGGGDEFTTWNAICSSSINADIIVNGASRAYRQVNPFILDTMLNLNTYNIGMSGASFDQQYVRYLTFVKLNKKPKYIIQQVDYGSLFVSNSVDERFLPYLPYLDGKKYLAGITLSDSYIPFYRYRMRYDYITRGLLEFFHIKHYPNLRKKGFFETDLKWNGSSLNTVLQGDSINALKEIKAIELFDSYLNHCKNNDIMVILVFSPQYFKMTDFTKDKKDVIDIYRSFSEKYGIPFLDYSTDSMCYDTTYFFNAMHLNKTGEELFSTKLAHDIDSLKIIK